MYVRMVFIVKTAKSFLEKLPKGFRLDNAADGFYVSKQIIRCGVKLKDSTFVDFTASNLYRVYTVYKLENNIFKCVSDFFLEKKLNPLLHFRDMLKELEYEESDIITCFYANHIRYTILKQIYEEKDLSIESLSTLKDLEKQGFKDLRWWTDFEHIDDGLNEILI